jgi:hypothetical protein
MSVTERYVNTRGQIYDRITGRWMGPYDAARLAELNRQPSDPPAEPADVPELSLTELRAQASELGISGRSRMDRDELVEAIASEVADGDPADED